MEITNNNYNTMPEQVQENKDNIKVLAEYIKEAYNATTTLETSSTTINASMVRDWVAGTTKGFILDQAGKLFKIVAVSDNTIFIQWWASLPQGATGATGARGETGAKGDKGDAGVGFNNTTDINLVVGDPSVLYDTEDGITITSQGGIEADGQTFSPMVEQNIPLIAGNGLVMDATEDGKHVDIHLSTGVQSKLTRALLSPINPPATQEIVSIGTNGAQQLLEIGAGLSVENGALKASGGGSGKYIHNILLRVGNIRRVTFTLITGNANPFTTETAQQLFNEIYNQGFIDNTHCLNATGYQLNSQSSTQSEIFYAVFVNNINSGLKSCGMRPTFTKQNVTIENVEYTFLSNITTYLDFDTDFASVGMSGIEIVDVVGAL